MKKLLLLLIVVSSLYAQEKIIYKDVLQPVEVRVQDLLSKLTFDEKIDLLGGTGFATKPISRLGIPELRMTDGPVGARWNPSTAFPASAAMAATWNPELIYKVGAGIGRETKGKGRHVILGPCVNIVRVPMGGRNFESFGEDPFLTSRMAVDYIKGVQSEGVAATVKHFAVNNHEHERMFVDVIVSERALNEIYFPAFKAAVQEADVLCLMNSYNKVNRQYAAENGYLLDNILKKQWGFKGLVMSDWGAVHSSIPTAQAGMDLEMPFGTYLNKETLEDAIKNGVVPQSIIDDKVKRILTVIIKLGLIDQPEWLENSSLVNSAENRKIAYQTALESIVLLKNEDGILPINLKKIKSVAIVGPSAKNARTGGGGSAYVTPIDPVSPFDGLSSKLSGKLDIRFAEGVTLEGDAKGIPAEYLFTDESMKTNGLTAEYFDNLDLKGTPKVKRVDRDVNFRWDDKSPADGIGEDNFSVRWTGYLKAPESGLYTISTSTDDGARLWINDELVINDWSNHAVLTLNHKIQFEKDKLYKVRYEYYENGGGAVAILGWNEPNTDLVNDAVEAAKNSDYVIVFAGTSDQIETEGRDRDNLFLPGDQERLIQKVSEVNKNVIVVLTTGAPVVMSNWISKVDAVIEMWLAGSEGGNAIADILLGNHNPSGKLPVSFPKRWEDCSAYSTFRTFPARTYYADDIYVGYRHFDSRNIEPLFPFGYGLSYTTFEYSDLSVKENGADFEVSFKLKNSGKVKGAEVAQIYVSDHAAKIDRPVKELKSFKKVDLNPGEVKTIILKISKNDIKYFDGQSGAWKYDSGEFEFLIASSSRDIKLTQKVEVK